MYLIPRYWRVDIWLFGTRIAKNLKTNSDCPGFVL